MSPTLRQADSRKLAAMLFTDGEELGPIRDEESRQRQRPLPTSRLVCAA
ncbi:MAG TPA: hypothetical protein VGX03_29610 [Candidatus Binatia bacterium]|nr:hypothetical protein [Candidatus Binatia bacterium]